MPRITDEQRHARLLADHVRGAYRYLSTLVDQLGVNLSDVMALVFLKQHGRLTAKQLGKSIGITSGSLTVLIDRLEGVGAVERQPNPDDRRSVFVVITPNGLAQLEPLDYLLHADAAAGLAAIARGQRAAVLTYLEAVAKHRLGFKPSSEGSLSSEQNADPVPKRRAPAH